MATPSREKPKEEEEEEVSSDGLTKKGARCKKNMGALLSVQKKVISKKKSSLQRCHRHCATIKKDNNILLKGRHFLTFFRGWG